MKLQCDMADKIASTHVLMEKTLVVYRRERSSIWQCRFKVGGVWQRASTKETKLADAKEKAKALLIEAEFRKRNNLPVVTRRFRDVAKLAIERMQKEKADCNGVGRGIASFADYIIVINKYLIPCLGNRNVTSIDHATLDEFDVWRTEQMGKAPSHSTIQTHNAALNRVFDEAIIRNYLTDANRPKLDTKGRRTTERRAAFDLAEVRALIDGFDGWIDGTSNESIKESRLLMRDYVMILLDTGARPGKELLNLKWKQIRNEKTKIDSLPTQEFDEDGEQIVDVSINRTVSMPVKGKTGLHTILGMHGTVEALIRIAKRNYDEKFPITNPLQNIIKPSNDDYVLRKRDKSNPSVSFQKMFMNYLKERDLLIDPITGQKRVFYSLRHTYATFKLENDKVSIHTLAEQMHTSVGMIEKHYSHLNLKNVIEELRGEETQKLINAVGVIDAAYKFDADALNR